MKLFLIDGNSFCYRAFYAIRDLRSSTGRPTNAVYGVITMIRKLLAQEKPDMIAVAFDLKGPTFRHEKYKEYKIHRKPMPQELADQLPLIKEVLSGYRIPIYQKEGYEADDVLATLAVQARKKKMEVYLVTGDKDMLQLVDDNVKVYNTHKDGEIYDSRFIEERFHTTAEHLRDVLALMGDVSDNIPGVPGIGEKTAVELIAEFKSLDNLYKHLDRLKSAAKQKLLASYKDQAFLSRELATLDTDLPLEVDFDSMRISPPDNQRLGALFKELEFKTLLKELIGQTKPESEPISIDTEKKWQELLGTLKTLRHCVIDFQTTSPNPVSARIVGISFCWKKKECYSAPASVADGDEHMVGQLKDFFEDPDITKCGHNIKYEMAVLAQYGVELKGIIFDTMVASYLINPAKTDHNLDELSLEYLGYMSDGSDTTLRLQELLDKKLKDLQLDRLFSEVEIPLIAVLARMENAGVSIDRAYLNKMSSDMEKDLKGLCGDIYDIAGEEFNINSPKQLSRVLFETLKLPVIKKTKTGFSTDVGVLEKLAQSHKLPEKILAYRELAKLKSTYVDALPQMVNPRTGRLHTSYNQTVTQTGRLSSSEPNLQNIPIRTELGRKIRRAFVTRGREYLLLSADYSQIELRILAHLSQDERLITAFKQGKDIHNDTASLIFGLSAEELQPSMRAAAKTVNFGIIYGMSPYGLSGELGIDVPTAEKFIQAYFSRYPDVKAYLDSQIEQARTAGFVTTIFKRRRYLSEINSSNLQVRNFAERAAINAPIQGSAADLIKIAMIGIDSDLRRLKLRTNMIMQVHDELVLEVLRSEEKDILHLIRKHMEEGHGLSVPVKVNISVGDNWLDMVTPI